MDDIYCATNKISALALVDVLGLFMSEIGFRTPKIRRSDLPPFPNKILYVRQQ